MTFRIPLSKPDLSGNESKYVQQAIGSTWISSTGDFIDKFEQHIARMAGLYDTRRAVSTCNGTSALHLALLALDVRPGDEVLIPALTYVAVANACRYVGAVPVFVDVDPDTWCINPLSLEDAVTPRTRGIIAVHTYGHPADMDAINKFAGVHGLWVVEDAAEAHGAVYKNRPVGALSDIGVFSFYGNKIVTTGEGGACVTTNKQLEARLRALRGQGVDPYRRYFFPIVGYNFRMTNVAAAIGCGQMERLDQILEQRSCIYDRYTDNFKNTATISLQTHSVAPWLFCILVDVSRRDAVMKNLTGAGIESRPFFLPLNELPPYREEHGRNARSAFAKNLPMARKLSLTGINLPTYPGLKNEEIDEICNIVKPYSF